MKPFIRKMLVRKAAMAVVIPVALAAMAGGSFAVAMGSTHGRSATAPQTHVTSPATGTDHTPRFHGDATTPCPLPDAANLTGNWTHGQYVSAWNSAHDAAAVKTAAASSCGLPLTAATHKAAAKTKGSDASTPADTSGSGSGDLNGSSNDHQGSEVDDPAEDNNSDSTDSGDAGENNNDNSQGGSSGGDHAHGGGGDNAGGHDHGGDSGGSGSVD